MLPKLPDVSLDMLEALALTDASNKPTRTAELSTLCMANVGMSFLF